MFVFEYSQPMQQNRAYLRQLFIAKAGQATCHIVGCNNTEQLLSSSLLPVFACSSLQGASNVCHGPSCLPSSCVAIAIDASTVGMWPGNIAFMASSDEISAMRQEQPNSTNRNTCTATSAAALRCSSPCQDSDSTAGGHNSPGEQDSWL